MSDITMITYPIIAFLLTRLRLKVPMWLSACVYVGVVAVFSYWFLGISIVELRPVAFIAYSFYLVLSFVAFYFFSKHESPVVTFSASIVFVYTVLRFWEVPAFVLYPTFNALQTTPELLLWCLLGLTLLWIMLKPKTVKIVWLLAGLSVLFMLYVAFFFSGASLVVGRFGNETYFMVGRIVGAVFMFKTFVRGKKNE